MYNVHFVHLYTLYSTLHHTVHTAHAHEHSIHCIVYTVQCVSHWRKAKKSNREEKEKFRILFFSDDQMIRSSDNQIIDHHCAQAPRLIPASDALFYVFLIATKSICIFYLILCIFVFCTLYIITRALSCMWLGRSTST